MFVFSIIQRRFSFSIFPLLFILLILQLLFTINYLFAFFPFAFFSFHPFLFLSSEFRLSTFDFRHSTLDFDLDLDCNLNASYRIALLAELRRSRLIIIEESWNVPVHRECRASTHIALNDDVSTNLKGLFLRNCAQHTNCATNHISIILLLGHDCVHCVDVQRGECFISKDK